MEPDTFQIAFNKEQVQYYQYLRQQLQTNESAYWIGNPSVEIANGTLYFKENPLVPPEMCLQNFEDYLKLVKEKILPGEKMRKQKILALMGIPNNKTPIEIYESLVRFRPRILQTKVIKTTHSKYYGMLLLFEDEELSTLFFNEAFGEEYNGIEIERIIVRQLIGLTYSVTGLGKAQSDLNILALRTQNSESQKLNPEDIFRKAKNSQKIISKMNSSSKEDKKVQTCVICFEENQETMISILCGHYFHWECLMRWKQDTCPLCRYHQHPPVIKFCEQCNQCEGLWVCLICGARLCCGFDNNILGSDSHIYMHYQETSHNLSMQLQTKFLFDAKQPAFLHQKFYKELKENNSQLLMQEKCSKSKTDKLKDKISEYEQNISEQMQRQRAFFEENIGKEIKGNRQVLTTKKTRVSELECELKQIDEKLGESFLKREEINEENEKLEKEIDIIRKVQIKLRERAQKIKEQKQAEDKKEKTQIEMLNRLIKEKKEELKDYKKNKQLGDKIKTNIGNDKVAVNILLGGQGKHQKKK